MARNNRNAFPGVQTGTSPFTKLVVFAVVIALGVIVVKYPGDAGDFVKGFFGFAGDVISGLVLFFRSF